MPKRLLPRYGEALNDQTWASLRDEIALIDSRINEVMAQLDTGEAGALWSALTKRWDEYRQAPVTRQAEALDAIGAAILAGASEQAKWTELAKHVDQRRTLVESERKRVLELQQVLTSEQAAALFRALTETIKRHVTDRKALSAISIELSRLAVGEDVR